jgi:phage host-nuclease inhibitor protein Gam
VNANDLTLWILGAVFTLVTSLGVLLLRLILKQGGDTNEKVTETSREIGDLRGTLGRLEVSSTSNASEVSRLRDHVETLRADVSKLSGAHELAKAFVEALNSTVTVPTRRRRTDA